MSDKKKADQKKGTPNVSVHYYTDPVYGSGSIYGIDDYGGEEPEVRGSDVKEGAADEPVESWGWINNVDPK